MVHPLNNDKHDPWNELAVCILEQPGARVASDLQAENGPWRNLRRAAVTDRAIAARYRARRRYLQETLLR